MAHELTKKISSREWVKARKRFVKHQEFRRASNRQRDCELGALAARELGHPLPEVDADSLQPSCCSFMVERRVEGSGNLHGAADRSTGGHWTVLGDVGDPRESLHRSWNNTVEQRH